MSRSIKRLIKLFNKQGLSVDYCKSVYKISKTNTDAPVVEILLPNHFDLDLKAVKQLIHFADVKHPDGGVVYRALATPDFHAGSSIPVGAVVSTTKDLIIPQAIGTDIHCGMRMHTIDIDINQWENQKSTIVDALKSDLLLGTRNLPMSINSFRALFQHGLNGWIDTLKKASHGDLQCADLKQLEHDLAFVFNQGSEAGDVKWAPESLVVNHRPLIRDSSLATIGGGNHFVEFQVVEEIIDRKQAFAWGVRKGQLAVMIHTGSRAVGVHVGTTWNDIARRAWPQKTAYPASKIFPLSGEKALQYLSAMNTAANYANANRLLLAEIVRLRMRQIFSKELEIPLIYDAPHNIVTEESGCFVHRKGATPAHYGQPVLIPGSMGHHSYLMMGLGNENFLSSASHGAGRGISRHEMFRRHKANEDLGLTCIDCITLKEDRKIEEAPSAYKNVDEVVDIQVQKGMVNPVAKLKPLVTFKG